MHEGELKTKILFKDEARQELLKGMATVADAVGCTLGPRGKTVIIQRQGFTPLVTKDGVTVSKSIKLKDPVQATGADLIKQAAERTNEIAGDGTTTSTVLTFAMVSLGNKLLSNGFNAQQVCHGIEASVKKIYDALKLIAKPIATPGELAHVATISANGDKHIGDLVAQAMDRVGRDGIITVEDAMNTATSLDVVEGLQFERGYLSPYFINNDRMNVNYADARVLITDKKLSDFRQLQPILEKMISARFPLLIIADDIDGEALQTLVLNRVKASLPVVAIKAPGYGSVKDEMLEDLCVLTGAQLISSKTGLTLEAAGVAQLGTVKKLIVDAKSTTLVADGRTAETTKQRIEKLRAQVEDVTLNNDEITNLRTRIARLASGVAVIRVGGATEVEMNERKHRIEDALHATRAAAEEGIVPGGGMALVSVINALGESVYDGLTGDARSGATLVTEACLSPIKRIVENSGKSPDVVLNELSRRPGLGYDAARDDYVDMIESGIIDPAKVCRTALQHAASVAVVFLTLDAVVCDLQETK